jgi:hypothetical protein
MLQTILTFRQRFLKRTDFLTAITENNCHFFTQLTLAGNLI